jgi:hypothetical protein
MHALSGTLRDANLRSEREKGGMLPDMQGDLTTTGLLIVMSQLRTHVKAIEQTGWLRRLTSLLYRAIRRRGSVAPL